MSKFKRKNKPIGFLGIDPGQSGAVALISSNLEIISINDWPGSEIQAANILKECLSMCTLLAALERVHSMPQQGVVSTFKFGVNFGVWKGILAALNISWTEPTPQMWMKGHKNKADGKRAIANAAMKIFSGCEKLIFGPKGGLKDGRADALMIAYWCRQQQIAKEPYSIHQNGYDHDKHKQGFII